MKSSLLVSLLPLMTMSPAARLDVDHQPFVRDFRASGGVRLVAVLSPT